jgi:hypothetical protein
MRKVTGAVGKFCFFLLVVVAPSLSQNHMSTGATPAGTGPEYDVGVGYTYVPMQVPGAGRATLKGVDVNGLVTFKPRWGVTADSNFARTSNVLGTKHIGYLLTLQGGPVFYPVSQGNTRMFIHLLGGMGLVDGAVPISATSYFHGWQSRFSYAMGGGVERSLMGRFGVRVSADYLRTSFYDSAGLVLPQNDFRLSTSLIFRLNNRAHRRVIR